VRKHAKDTGGEGGAGVEVEALDDGGDGTFFEHPHKVNPLNAASQTRLLRRRKRLPLSCLGKLQRYTLKY
jgi:hypothetical protein